MKTAMLLAPRRLVVQETERPHAAAGELIVKVRAALTCGTDLKAYLRGHPQIPMPGPLGHEFSGVVAEVGQGVSGFAVGDAVMAVHSAPCGNCYWCVRGQGNLCPDVMRTKVLGAYAEYVRIPAHIVRCNTFHKPPQLDFAEAALLEPLACVAHALRQVRVEAGDTVLVVGSGAIGLLFLLALRAQGVHNVVVAGRRAFRLRLAAALGASHIIDAEHEDVRARIQELSEGRGADLVIECTGSSVVWEATPAYVRRGGQIVLFGGLPKGTRVSFDSARLHYDQISLTSPFHFDPAAVRQAFDWLAEGQVQGGSLISGTTDLFELPAKFEELQTGNCVKFAVIP